MRTTSFMCQKNSCSSKQNKGSEKDGRTGPAWTRPIAFSFVLSLIETRTSSFRSRRAPLCPKTHWILKLRPFYIVPVPVVICAAQENKQGSCRVQNVYAWLAEHVLAWPD